MTPSVPCPPAVFEVGKILGQGVDQSETSNAAKACTRSLRSS